MPFFTVSAVYLLIGAALCRSGCNGINHADGMGEGLLATIVGVGGALGIVVSGLLFTLGARARQITGRPYRRRLWVLVLGLAPFAIYGWIRLTGG